MNANPGMTQVLKLADKDFKAATLTVLKDIRENMLVVNEPIETINKNQMASPQPEHMVRLWGSWSKRSGRPCSRESPDQTLSLVGDAYNWKE